MGTNMPGRPHWPIDLVRQTYAKTNGRCFHCGAALPWVKGGRRTWHMDHHPVAYRDIEDQVCFGVRDPLDPTNVVPSCAACNTSHAHERSVCCGYTQCRCRRRWCAYSFVVSTWAAMLLCIGTLALRQC